MREIYSKYRIIKELGEGGMGKVYLVEHESLGKRYAMKLCEGEAECRERKQLKNEAERMKMLDDRRIPYLVDYFEEEDVSGLVMEYVTGETLAERIARQCPFSENDTLVIMKKLAAVVAFLHAQNPQLIYGDIKPENFIITPEGELRLIDFGTALSGHGELRPEKMAGTYGYCPPEQRGGKSISAAADVYAMAVLAVFMLTGIDPSKPPYHAADPGEWPKLSAGFAALLTEALSADPAGRPQDAGIMLGRLQKLRPEKNAGIRAAAAVLYRGLLFAAISAGMLMIRAAVLGRIYLAEERIFFTLCGIIATWRFLRSLRERRGGFTLKREWNVIYTEKTERVSF
ncbi:MAG: serine/threonine protein kinase [Lachnospiraceae bacterium]|nr:serine/threonine protein kinase [Lachnospiraceae bacterium]